MENIALLGPFLGDFAQEVLTFYPYVNWLKENLKNIDKIYISVLDNRKFLYNDCDFFDLKDDIFYDETAQYHYINTKISKKEFEEIQKGFKAFVANQEKVSKKICRVYSLPYSQNNTTSHTVYQKIFSPVKLENSSFIEDIKDYVVLIPDITEDPAIYASIIDYFIKNDIKYLIIGDKKIHFKEMNLLTDDNCDFKSDVYENILKIILNCKALVSSANHWIYLSNLHNKKNFSWGNYIGNYKRGGLYNFDNGNASSLFFNSINGRIDILIKQLDHFLEGVK